MSEKKPRFASEAAMCAEFIAVVEADKKWIAYPETAGWDILLVRKEDGFQIGIQAKLKFGIEVVNQAIEDRWGFWRPEGVDCRAVLVPEQNHRLGQICAFVGITVVNFRPASPGYSSFARIDPDLPTPNNRFGFCGEAWYELCPIHRCKLPEYVPDVAAGASGPLQLTEWKINAIKIAVILDLHGVVTRSDFQALRIDHRRWLSQEWLRPSPEGWRRYLMPDFKTLHPRVYAEITADAAKWMPPRPSSLFSAG